jgi:hypothetical protein
MQGISRWSQDRKGQHKHARANQHIRLVQRFRVKKTYGRYANKSVAGKAEKEPKLQMLFTTRVRQILPG